MVRKELQLDPGIEGIVSDVKKGIALEDILLRRIIGLGVVLGVFGYLVLFR